MITKERLEDFWILSRRFSSMKTRCYNKNNPAYKNYGGRGIKICDEWLNDKNKFIEWSLVNGFRKELTIDRKDNNGNYEPNNCWWVDRKTQNNNKRNIVRHKCFGEYLTITEASKKYKISFKKLETRINSCGLTLEQAIKIGNKKKQKKDAKLYKYNNKNYTLKDLEKIYNIKSHTIYERICKGISVNKALTVPVKHQCKICQFNKEMKLMKIYNTLTEAGRQTNIPDTNISNCCKGKRKTAGGYIWQYQKIV